MRDTAASAREELTDALLGRPPGRFSGSSSGRSSVREGRPPLEDTLQRYLHEDAVWEGFHPLNRLRGREAIVEELWRPLRTAFPDFYRRDDIFISGAYEGEQWLSCIGYYVGNFERSWLGIPPSGKLAWLRFGEFHRIDEGRIVETAMLVDLLDLLRQMGIRPLPPGLGSEELAPPPSTHDGVVAGDPPAAETAKSLRTVEEMLLGLNTPDRRWMPYWHPDMLWHGPCGIGSFRGIPAFDRFQVPFENAFTGWGGGIHGHTSTRHTTRFAHGNYVTSGGFPSVTGRHDGEWLGFAPTGTQISMRVMDWWRRDGELLAENWVMIDMVDVLLQLGRDVLDADTLNVSGDEA